MKTLKGGGGMRELTQTQVETKQGGEAMKQELTQQTQAQLGGEAQQKTLGGGKAMKKARKQVEVATYSLYDCDELGSLEKVCKIVEACDCYELYGSIKHNNGGNYHSVIEVWRIPNTNFYIFIYGSTRETFEGDDFYTYYILVDGKPMYCFTIRSDESYALYNGRKAKKIIRKYERDENFTVYYYRDEEH
jgi:hypothetical protein